ncbi:40S ribosomal protein S5-1 [Hordeum vulgare]|nr:40S ribosomal protein S5-1 [Hordeum vulgare]
MAASSSSKDKFFDNVINPYLWEIMQHPQAIQMCDGVLHIRDVRMCTDPRGLDPWRLGLKLWSRKSSGARGWWNVGSMPITS